jgi:hypothetical protein
MFFYIDRDHYDIDTLTEYMIHTQAKCPASYLPEDFIVIASLINKDKIKLKDGVILFKNKCSYYGYAENLDTYNAFVIEKAYKNVITKKIIV